MNIMVDLIIGVIPVLGDLFDVAWKANLRNARLIEKLEENPEKIGKESTVFMWILFTVLVLILIGVVIAIGWIVAMVWKSLF